MLSVSPEWHHERGETYNEALSESTVDVVVSTCKTIHFALANACTLQLDDRTGLVQHTLPNSPLVSTGGDIPSSLFAFQSPLFEDLSIFVIIRWFDSSLMRDSSK